jgi:serine/threonine-protein kinase
MLARVGSVVAGNYRITRHLGSGGSGHVFEVEHLRLGKPFALKMLRSDVGLGRTTVQRFRREARALARVVSEHVVSVVDCGELENGTPYLVMERLAGEDLRTLLNRSGPLLPRRAVHIMIEACRGLSVVHEAGLVHRDLKPENLFIAQRSSGEDWCKVLDFGVARMDASQSTAQGAIVGTVRYMAPEQLTDVGSVGPRADVYALGAILHECLTGTPLHDGDTVQAIMYSVMNREPVIVEQDDPMLAALTRLIARSTSKAPAHRPHSTAELAALLQAALRGETLSVSDQTLTEDDGSPRASSSGATKRRRAWQDWLRPASRFALVGGVAGALGWAAHSAMQDPPRVASAARAEPASPRVAATPAPTPAAPLPQPAATQAAVAAGAAERAAEVAKKRRGLRAASPTPTAVTAPSVKTQDAALGRFDAANPYGD